MERVQNVLVIAPDAILRRSLVFLLEAEGYLIQAHDTVDHAAEDLLPRRRCAVVDDASVKGRADAWARLPALAEEIVLLLDKAAEVPEGLPVRMVVKPLLGDRLVQSVRAAMHHPGGVT